MKEKKINWGPLLALVSCLTANTALVGFVIAGNNQIGSILAAQVPWTADEAQKYNTAISSLSVSGLFVGSFAVGPLLKFGRRKVLIWMNILAAISIIPTLILNTYLIFIGKFFFGFASGCIIVACSIYQNETVPAEKENIFGFTVNFGVIIGVTICLVMGFALPDPVKQPIESESTKFWIVILCVPELIIACCLPCWLFIFRNESLKYSLDRNDIDAAKKLMTWVYKEEAGEEFATHQEIIESLQNATRASQKVVQVSYVEALCDPKYRRATWLGMSIAFFNQMTGINLISIYSTKLFESFQSGSIDPITGSALVGIAQFVGCLCGPVLGQFLGLKYIFVFGQIAMGLAEYGVAICVGQNGTTSTTVCLLLFLFFYQATQGSYFWFYVAGICCETANSTATMMLWGIVLFFSIGSSIFFDGLGNAATFYLFGTICMVGAITFMICMKELNGLTKEEKQTLYSENKKVPLADQDILNDTQSNNDVEFGEKKQ